MTKCVIPQIMSAPGNLPREIGMPLRFFADDKKRSLRPRRGERIEQSRSVFRMWTIIERQRDFDLM